MYSVYRACERFGIQPVDWDDLDVESQALYLAYSMIRDYEDDEKMALLMGAKITL